MKYSHNTTNSVLYNPFNINDVVIYDSDYTPKGLNKNNRYIVIGIYMSQIFILDDNDEQQRYPSNIFKLDIAYNRNKTITALLDGILN